VGAFLRHELVVRFRIFVVVKKSVEMPLVESERSPCRSRRTWVMNLVVAQRSLRISVGFPQAHVRTPQPSSVQPTLMQRTCRTIQLLISQTNILGEDNSHFSARLSLYTPKVHPLHFSRQRSFHVPWKKGKIIPSLNQISGKKGVSTGPTDPFKTY